MGTTSEHDRVMHPERESDEAIARGLDMTVEAYRERVALLMKQVEELRERQCRASRLR